MRRSVSRVNWPETAGSESCTPSWSGPGPALTLPNQPTQPEPDPAVFDYDMWLGPAPWAPYTFQRSASRAEGSPGYWMHIHDYGLGCLSGAWGIHHIDIAQWANGTDDTGPLEIEGTGVLPKDGLCDTPLTWRVEHMYANGVKMLHIDATHIAGEFPQIKNSMLPQREAWSAPSRHRRVGPGLARRDRRVSEVAAPGDLQLR